ncbi:Phage portal protein, SPP1 Gp6-like [Desulfotomaculum arcticum]|uniref:Phage portal protein, SPP1 Gp6-like n=1 Tax=Desulfotruncus arcticus DSM 17038 TaxID=1121424 RepID=A0A1I2Y6X5_9FIRM|nr:phage portal protein [Desulfotruncus arcticus]SFH21460.1 Phage portal protein, SPP1 Gp6-like [Desulfotomaculum arcticum] [Desulfotruncus arcticus DSM 17038]
MRKTVNKAAWYKRAAGEISKLRNAFSVFTSFWALRTGSYFSAYKLDSSRVDYARARALYDNTDDKYKLGAGFSKGVINTTAGFMGVPRFKSEDETAQEVLDDFFSNNTSRMMQVQRNAMRDGDWFVWITREENHEQALYPEQKVRLIFNMLPPEQVVQIIKDPLNNNQVKEYVIQAAYDWLDDLDNAKRALVTQRISATRRVIGISGDIPAGLASYIEEDNPWGFIPIVHFKNEGDDTKEFGQSDLEPIEPFLKAYHDVLLHALQGSKMHSTPRLKFTIKDLAGFLRNNFGISDPYAFASQGGTISLDGHEFFLFSEDEDAEFIEVKSAIGDTTELLKFLFYCIVDTSETPEFAFGVHTPSSLSSVKEQMPILVRKIARKREQFTESWQRLARIVLALTDLAGDKKAGSYATVLEWDEVDPRDEKEVVEILKNVTEALKTALEAEIMSDEAATEFLKQFVNTMNDYISDDPEVPGERERIMKTRLLRQRLEDSQFLDEQKARIDRELAGGNQ